MLQIGDLVKVNDQDISGVIVELYGNKLVIIDDNSEYEYPDNRLEYYTSEVTAL